MTEKQDQADADATAEEIADTAPMPDAAETVEDFLPPQSELVIHDTGDDYERAVVMDAHDVAMIVQRAQSSALRKWVYELPDGSRGLTVHACQDIAQQMNWTGKTRIGVLPETLAVKQITADEGNGPEPYWVATIFAYDEATGSKLPGSSMQAQWMQLRPSTAEKWRRKGKTVPENNRVFDIFSRTKAIQKATRNALVAHIPQELRETIIAMFADDPSRVQRIQTEAEAKLAELPPPLTDPEAQAQVAKAREIYDRIRELGEGRGKVEFTPARFNAFLTQAQHSHERLDDFVAHLQQRHDEIKAKFGAAS